MSIKKNDIVEILIDAMTSEGNGIGRLDGMVIFVPASAVGDKLKVKILKVKKNYAFGKIEEILEPSKSRIKSDCMQYLKCGGCVYRHINYNEEKKIKKQKVIDALKKIGGFENIKVNDIIGSKNVDNYRNKAQLPIGKNKDGDYELGFFANHSHRIVNCTECNLQPDIFKKVIDIFKVWLEETSPTVYDEKTGKGLLRHLYIRQAENESKIELMVCIIINSDQLPMEKLLVEYLTQAIPQIKSIIVNINKDKTNVIMGKKCKTLWGKDYITDKLCDKNFNISAHSFYQVNKKQAEVLYQLAATYANCNKSDILLDLYCGTGTIGLTMADKCKKLIGVEIVSEAIENAKNNSKINNVNNAEFICSDAEKAADMLLERGEHPNVIIVDPPRKGCSMSLINTIVKMNPERIVYVSCDPATLARDLKILAEKKYNIIEVTPVDMFPQTSHVETVCLLSRKH